MGLFGKKKKRNVSNLPELPRFSDNEKVVPIKENKEKFPLVSGEVELPKSRGLPAYESAFEKEGLGAKNIDETKPVEMGLKVEELPERRPDFIKAQPEYRERFDDEELNEVIPRVGRVEESSNFPFMKEQNEPVPARVPLPRELEQPLFVEPKNDITKKEIKIPKHVEEKPVFVQIDDYRDAMNGIEVLKQKVREVEYILDRLGEIKSQEQIEMSNCETSLNKIKEKLVEVDKKLFEI